MADLGMEQRDIREEDCGVLQEGALSQSSYWASIRRSFVKNRLAVLGLIILSTIIFMSAAAPLFTSHHPVLDMKPSERLQAPGAPGHFLGTDEYGRDVWSRILYGGRTSVVSGLAVTLIAGFTGILIGLCSGYFGGVIDALLMRITDIMLSFPFMIIAIALIAALGPSQRNIILALALVSWPGFARLTRSQVLSIKEQEYIEAAKVGGFKSGRIMFNHILPNCLGPLIVQLTLSVGNAILSAASLNFLGMGADSTLPDWGVMLNSGRSYLQTDPHLTLIPGIAISLTVLSMNWIGDGLRDALDPKMRK